MRRGTHDRVLVEEGENLFAQDVRPGAEDDDRKHDLGREKEEAKRVVELPNGVGRPVRIRVSIGRGSESSRWTDRHLCESWLNAWAGSAGRMQEGMSWEGPDEQKPSLPRPGAGSAGPTRQRTNQPERTASSRLTPVAGRDASLRPARPLAHAPSLLSACNPLAILQDGHPPVGAIDGCASHLAADGANRPANCRPPPGHRRSLLQPPSNNRDSTHPDCQAPQSERGADARVCKGKLCHDGDVCMLA